MPLQCHQAPSSFPYICLVQPTRHAVSTGAFPNSPPAGSSPLPSWPPFPLPVPSLHLPQSPPPSTQQQPVSHIPRPVPRPAAEIKRRKVVASEAWRTPGPPGIFSLWVGSSGLQQSWGTRSHLSGPQTPPHFLPSPAGDWLHWPHCWALQRQARGQPLPVCFRI